jgi:MSHA biogenesis protein MshJ
MKTGWKDVWEKQSARINALSLRERMFLFLSVMVCCVALLDMFWLSPAQLAHHQLTQRFEQQSAELQRARDALKAVATPTDKSKGVRDELVSIKSRLDAVNQSIKEVLPTAAQATPLAQVLIPLLRRHEGLTLVRTLTLPPEVTVKAPQTGSLTRQGLELTVSGSYAELTRYAQTLEQALPYVRWGNMKLRSDKPPAELTLQLFLVGVQP